MVGRQFENKPVLPTIEQGVSGLALGEHLIAPGHDVERHEWREPPREVVVGVVEFGQGVHQDQYLANDIFCLGGR